jgi:hypothetical protein
VGIHGRGTGAALARGTLQRLTDSSDADDVDPVYLPAGRGFVFTQQPAGPVAHLQALGRNYLALDEYERERVFNLHTMAADGSGPHSRSASTRATTATR